MGNLNIMHGLQIQKQIVKVNGYDTIYRSSLDETRDALLRCPFLVVRQTKTSNVSVRKTGYY